MLASQSRSRSERKRTAAPLRACHDIPFGLRWSRLSSMRRFSRMGLANVQAGCNLQRVAQRRLRKSWHHGSWPQYPYQVASVCGSNLGYPPGPHIACLKRIFRIFGGSHWVVGITPRLSSIPRLRASKHQASEGGSSKWKNEASCSSLMKFSI